MNASECTTIAHPHFGNEAVVLSPTDGGRPVIVSRRHWLTALPLAALGGWDATPPRHDRGLRLFGAAGQTLDAETGRAIAAGIRPSVARLLAGDAKEEERFDARMTVLDIQASESQYARRYDFAPFAELVPLVRRNEGGEPANLPHVRALLALADALETLGDAILLDTPPADWISPDVPTARVVVNAHPSAGCCYQVNGFPRAAGDVVTVPLSAVAGIEQMGVGRRLTPEEIDALDNPAPAVTAPPKRKTLRQKIAAVVAGE